MTHIFDEYFANVAKFCEEKYGEECFLPLSEVKFEGSDLEIDANSITGRIQTLCPPRLICSTFASMSGHGDDNLYSEDAMFSNIRHEVCCNYEIY